MSSIPEFFSSSAEHNPFPNYSELISGGPVPHAAAGAGGAIWCGEEEFIIPYNFYGANNNVGLADGLFSSSSEKLGSSDCVVPHAFSHVEYGNMNNIMDLHEIIPGAQNYGTGSLGYNINFPHLENGFDQFGDDYCCAMTSFLPEFKPAVSLAGGQKGWGMQTNQMHGIDQESNMMKVSRYSEEERKERIVRYLKKRNQRNFNKTIKYACRKTLADRRVRVRGRFARNSELICDHQDDHDQQMVAPKMINELIDPSTTHTEMRELCFDDDAFQIKYDDDEDWQQNFAFMLLG